jgi:hypothetical protein
LLHLFFQHLVFAPASAMDAFYAAMLCLLLHTPSATGADITAVHYAVCANGDDT